MLLGKIATKRDTEFWDQVTRERLKWDEMLDKQADPARSLDRIHPQAVARAVSDLAKRDAVFTFDSRCGRPIGYAKADHNGSSARSTTPRSERRSARPTASRRSIARVRSSHFAATVDSTC